MPKSGGEKKGEGLCPCSEILHRDSRNLSYNKFTVLKALVLRWVERK
ncbi:hypothetical protein OIU74_011250, partial [Salix koriyanagi]